ncbi:hypothetical protein TNCV_4647031 [Trichonephila clavipes]|uniref:Uncharacterized protein n=1 Tax=Trichonephila clavipes TaxID=2585209 RepID=A0A8X6SY55_TRICX|nr:hypothetical protein TNCV_4647031 [Trichonephila clavipes]
MDNRQPSTSRSNPCLNSTDNCMNLSLPASTHSSRPGTPQDYAEGTYSNCKGLLKLANEIKAYSISINGCHKGFNDLIQDGLTDTEHPTMMENTRVLENLNERYQQALKRYTLGGEHRLFLCGSYVVSDIAVVRDRIGSDINHPMSTTKGKETNSSSDSPAINPMDYLYNNGLLNHCNHIKD